MIVESSGNLLDADTDAVVNTVNCVGVMGKGIALQFKRRYPSMFAEYERACKAGQVQTGRMLPVRTGEMMGPEWVINFPTKRHWRSPSRLEWIEEGLSDLRRVIAQLGIKSIAIPPLGAGNGGLNWVEVEPLIRSAFADDPDIRVQLYSPSAGPRNVAAPRKKPRMTPGRALLLGLVDQYVSVRSAVDPLAGTGASHLEIQKLLYFASKALPIPNMAFTQGKYGPYSDSVRHMLQEMEGGFTCGFGDGDDRVLALRPVEVTVEGKQQLVHFLDSPESRSVTETVDRVLEIVAGFEGAYGIELLATTHWVATEEKALTADAAAAAVQHWSERKGRIFTASHVGSALEHLRTIGALPV
ncbi:type II toxin-antitoxin system antitoxin DNA ADP-ribosyl glycohydrolase DarG [Mycobacteroides abscessus]|uniref:type II toxin-antitoxin system antitoxin DNA ADP-ribosyl glycohydrolase DarG n=1 Tax=Mycobacteroides abscessus TaxID=36809 RepID=UPI000C25B4AC|nr:macro domain-containing protein [Mycobacteroides abscessus]